ncbi:MAG: DUF721 domain-containing protein [Actinomycetota bacterium]
MGDVLGGVGRDLGLTGAIGTGRVWAHWAEIVGDAVADHAEPTSLRDGVLRIRTDSPTWATEIGYLGAEISRRANAIAGTPVVTEVRVWTGPGRIERPGSRPSGVPPRDDPGPDREPVGTGPQKEPLVALKRAREAWARRRRGGAG